MPEISIIVPVYRTEQYLHKCVQSILKQTFADFELILVNDGSPDKSGDLCEWYVQQDSRVKVIHQKNKGLSSARNSGLSAAKGRYIGFIDSDDWIHQDMYRLLYHDLKDCGAAIAACGVQKVFDTNNAHDERASRRACVQSGQKALADILCSRDPSGHTAWNRLYERKLFDTVRFPEGRLYEDAFTIPLLYGQCKQVCSRKDALYYYRQRPGSIMQRQFDLRSMDKLAAAEQVSEFVKTTFPALTVHAECFAVVGAMRLMADLYQEKKQYPLEYKQVKERMQIYNREAGKYLSLRHRLLLLLFKISPPSYCWVWKKKLNR